MCLAGVNHRKEREIFTTGIRGVYPHRNTLGFPRALDSLKVHWQLQRCKRGCGVHLKKKLTYLI
jgi:hypothetical protein